MANCKNKSELISSSLLIILLVLLTPTVIAKGGGGGSGGGSSSGGSSGSSGGGDGPYFYDLQCLDTGQLIFNQKPEIKPVIVKKQDGNNFTVEGEWKKYTFTSEEAVFNEQESYSIRTFDDNEKEFTCPGLKFSCKLVKISLKECKYNDSGVTAEFTLEGQNTKLEDLKFELSRDSGKNLWHAKKSFSPELKNPKITEKENSYEVKFEKLQKASKIQVSYDVCVGRYYPYSKIECIEKKNITEKKVEESKGEELKCSGYMSIQDRVKCRLNLRENEEDEYENFYPEECKERQDSKQCLQDYRAVQSCWKFDRGEDRINCVKKQLDISSIKEQKQACEVLEQSSKGQCIADLKRKAYGLIKFRLYDLEEEAEEMLEQGVLSEEDVAEFVVKMEQSKLAFNKASSKNEKKRILLEARKYWINLMKKVEK